MTGLGSGDFVRDSPLWMLLERAGSLFVEVAGNDALANLDEGLPAMAVGAALSGEGVFPRFELRTYWTWRNGGPGPIPGFPLQGHFCGLSMPSFTQALSLRKALMALNSKPGSPFPRFDDSWIPILIEGTSRMVVHDGSGDGVLRWYEAGQEDVPELFHSLEDMVSTNIAALERGVVMLHDGARLVFDTQAFYRIASERYPEISSLGKLAEG